VSPTFQETHCPLQSEVTALQKIQSHPSVVKLYSVIQTPEPHGKTVLLLEYIEGDDLNQILKNRKVTMTETITWMLQLFSALEFCHSRYIAHLDVKCENILLDRSGTVKLIDFGMSCTLEEGNPNQTCECYRGSPLYMCPEIFAKKPFNPFKADAWAAGIVYYRLVASGLFPWKSQSMNDLIEEIHEHDISYVANGFNKDNTEIINGLLELLPEKRFSVIESRTLLVQMKK